MFENLDNLFAVLEGIVKKEHEMGLYGQSLVKKSRYQPKEVPGKIIDAYFQRKYIDHGETFMKTFDSHSICVHCSKRLVILC